MKHEKKLRNNVNGRQIQQRLIRLKETDPGGTSRQVSVAESQDKTI